LSDLWLLDELMCFRSTKTVKSGTKSGAKNL
jgi:hypothetical protein